MRPRLYGMLALQAAHRTKTPLFYGPALYPEQCISITCDQGIDAISRNLDKLVWCWGPARTESLPNAEVELDCATILAAPATFLPERPVSLSSLRRAVAVDHNAERAERAETERALAAQHERVTRENGPVESAYEQHATQRDPTADKRVILRAPKESVVQPVDAPKTTPTRGGYRYGRR